MVNTVKKFTLPEFGYEVEIGKFAAQADGAVWLKQGGTVVLTTVVESEMEDFLGFFPLSVDYREMFSAAGKIPGGYFKREGRNSDKEVLTSRLIDRALRPLFPANFFNQVQVLNTVYSVDKEHMPNTVSLMSASLALMMSKIPFLGPVGVVEIAKINDEWVFSPSYAQAAESKTRIVVAGTKEGVCMLEGSSDGISEADFLNLLQTAHEKIKIQIKWQEDICKELNINKPEFKDEKFDWNLWESNALNFLTEDKLEEVCTKDKQKRNTIIKNFKQEFLDAHKDQILSEELSSKKVLYAFDNKFKSLLTDFVLKREKRVDGRDFDKVRDISVETCLLPFTHGSALFKRGDTQALVSTTLGGGQDEQRFEQLVGDETTSRFLLHYTFPPFSVGEVKPMRGPGRREVGHGSLAASALESILPDKDNFPYTIRVTSDILESCGSSSMATVCGSTMALMDAGVPIKEMVSGVAMGLFKGSDNNFQVISDLNGFEDAFGWMDFKVAGTDNGITAIQMDIKNKGGLPWEVFEKALKQAKESRNIIMKEMRSVMTEPKKELSDLVPKNEVFKISSNKIGAVIGSGGKTIREIIEKTDTSIDIEDDGTVKIFGTPGAGLEKAVGWVKTLAGQIKDGERYDGKIRRHTDFGMFVELVPGQDGLIHISAIPKDQQRDMNKFYPLNSILPVEVAAYDQATGRIRLKIAE